MRAFTVRGRPKQIAYDLQSPPHREHCRCLRRLPPRAPPRPPRRLLAGVPALPLFHFLCSRSGRPQPAVLPPLDSVRPPWPRRSRQAQAPSTYVLGPCSLAPLLRLERRRGNRARNSALDDEGDDWDGPGNVPEENERRRAAVAPVTDEQGQGDDEEPPSRPRWSRPVLRCRW